MRSQLRAGSDFGLPAPIIIDDDRSLARLVALLARQPVIALDTEANSLFAYQERLCLLQISSRNKDYLIDPLAGIDLSLLASIFADPCVQKILHGAEYDILLLKRSYPFEFSGLFDTMVAATSLGIPSPGLASMLSSLVGVQIDKKYQRSDWGKRPLSDGQLHYARCDTHYLFELAQHLRTRLYQAGSPHMEEVAAECRRVEALVPEERVFDPDEYARIKGVQKLDLLGCRVLRELNIMRHRLARKRDRPLFKVLGNEMLLALARSRPKSTAKLHKSRAISAKLADRYGEEIIQTIIAAIEQGPLPGPPPPERCNEDELTSDQRSLYDSLRRWRKDTATRRKTDASLILSKSSMLQLSKMRALPRSLGQLSSSGQLETWRIACYGMEVLQLFEDWRRSRRGQSKKG